MPDHPERLARFKEVFEYTTGVPGDYVQLSAGVNAKEAVEAGWALELLPSVYTDFEAGHLGNVGCCLAHMSAWKKVQDSPECQAPEARDQYALVFEDDESVKGVFPAAVRRLMRLLDEHHGAKPDFINLNVIRPTGETVPGGENLLSGSFVREVTKGDGFRECWDLTDTSCPNIWMSAYLVRCGGAAKLIAGMQRLELDGKPYDGTVTIDRAVTDMLMRSPPVSEVVSWVVGPNNSFSVHSEEVSGRKDLNGGEAN